MGIQCIAIRYHRNKNLHRHFGKPNAHACGCLVVTQWKKLCEALAKNLQKFSTIWPYQMLLVWLANADLAVSLTWCHNGWQHPTSILNRLCWRAWKALSKYGTVGKASKMPGNCCSYMLVGVQFYQCILLTVKRCGELNLTVPCFSKTYVQKECIFSSRIHNGHL